MTLGDHRYYWVCLTGEIRMHYRRIRDLREDANLSQRAIAENLFMNKTTYVNYELGKREIPLNIAILIAKYHHVSLDYLAGLTDEK